MRLKQLADLLLNKRVLGDPFISLSGLTANSRQVKPGNLFICLRGFTVDGHDFAAQAAKKGAAAFLTEKELPLPQPQVIVPDTRRAMAVVADAFFGYPTKKMKLIGVTGTNGKTTTTHLIQQIFEDAGYKTGLIGTIGMKIDGNNIDVKNTTPESVELQQAFSQMVSVGTDYAVMEVSSHALMMGRVRGCRYHTAVFTNLTQDHLDYHQTMERYREAKGLLFSQLGHDYPDDPKAIKTAVLNADDPASLYYQAITPAQVFTYGVENRADVTARNICISSEGTQFELNSPLGIIALNLQLTGKFSVYNALAAATVGLREGIGLRQIKSSLESVKGVDGRFEKVNCGQDYTVIVDYAHTPDSLDNVLRTIKEFAKGRIICVVGCGGDRDPGKRPLMADIALRYSDFSVFTSDNPRSEDPERILDDMTGHLTGEQTRWRRITDRRAAIEAAIYEARPQDVVLIAGKGHETYQIIKGQVHDFDDRLVAKLFIEQRGLQS